MQRSKQPLCLNTQNTQSRSFNPNSVNLIENFSQKYDNSFSKHHKSELVAITTQKKPTTEI